MFVCSCSFMSDFDIMLARRKALNSKRRRHRDGGTFINDADDVVSAMISKMNEAAEVGVCSSAAAAAAAPAAPAAPASLTVSLAGGPHVEQHQEAGPEEADAAAAGGHAPEEVSIHPWWSHTTTPAPVHQASLSPASSALTVEAFPPAG